MQDKAATTDFPSGAVVVGVVSVEEVDPEVAAFVGVVNNPVLKMSDTLGLQTVNPN